MQRKKNVLIYATERNNFLNLCKGTKSFPQFMHRSEIISLIYAQKEKHFINLCTERNHFQNLCTRKKSFH